MRAMWRRTGASDEAVLDAARADAERGVEPMLTAGLAADEGSSHRGAMVGLVIVAGVVLMAIFAPLLAPADPLHQDLHIRLTPPALLPGGSFEHLLGTDRLGRDMLSRIMFGARITLLIGLLGVTVGGAIGITTGLVAGYVGGWMDGLTGRLADTQQAIPFVILVLAVVAVLGASLSNLIIVLGVGSWIFSYRVVRGETLTVRRRPFVEASEALGADRAFVIRQHILPNVMPSIIVVVTLFVPETILFAAALSFLGLGVPPPTPEWGGMIADGSEYLRVAPWLALVPAGFLIITVLAINLVGDWLRDALDPVRRHAS